VLAILVVLVLVGSGGLALYALSTELATVMPVEQLAVATPEPEATLPSRPSPATGAARRIHLGAYVDDAAHDGPGAVRRLEALVGHKLHYVLWFLSWGDDGQAFPSEWVRQSARDGLTPVLTWEPWKRDFAQPTALQDAYSLGSIAAGQHDAYIRSWARAARSVGVPLVLRFAHEQSTEPGIRNWYPWQGDPEGYKAAFRRIVRIFREEGAENVRFLWSAMWLDAPWTPQYYPGDDVVDVVGTTVLNHGNVPPMEWSRWRSFEELFDSQYRAAERWGKPVMITELATAEQGGDKAAWLRDCFALLRDRYTLVEGVLLLEVRSDREWPAIDWSVQSSDASLEAFREAIAHPSFR
jgi:hypothetical protein